jgi:hypothetical protein
MLFYGAAAAGLEGAAVPEALAVRAEPAARRTVGAKALAPTAAMVLLACRATPVSTALREPTATSE